MRVRLLLPPDTPAGQTYRFEYQTNGCGVIVDRPPIPLDGEDPWFSRDAAASGGTPDWGYGGGGAGWETEPATVRPFVEPDEWVSLRIGEGVLLGVAREPDGRRRELRVWCVPPNLVDWNPPPGVPSDTYVERESFHRVIKRRIEKYMTEHALPVPPE